MRDRRSSVQHNLAVQDKTICGRIVDKFQTVKTNIDCFMSKNDTQINAFHSRIRTVPVGMSVDRETFCPLETHRLATTETEGKRFYCTLQVVMEADLH